MAAEARSAAPAPVAAADPSFVNGAGKPESSPPPEDDPAAQFVPEPPAPEASRQQRVKPMPAVTYLYVAAILLVTLACQQNLVAPFSLAFLPARFGALSFWTPLSCFLFFGDKFSWNLLLSVGVTVQYVSRLELGDFRGRRSDFVAMLLQGAATLIATTSLLWFAELGFWQATPAYILGHQLLDMLMVVFCLRNPLVQICIPMTNIAVQAEKYIFVNVLIGLVINCDESSDWGAAGFVLERELLGVGAGYIYHNKPVDSGSLPNFIRRWCGDDVPEATGLMKYLSTHGRASRSEYWWLVAKLIAAPCAALAALLWAEPRLVTKKLYQPTGLVYGAIECFLCLCVCACVLLLFATCRRLHDINMSQWNLLWGFVPVLGKDLLFDVVPNTAWNKVAVVGCCCWALYYLLLSGDGAPNRFGERSSPDSAAQATNAAAAAAHEAAAKQAASDAENAALWQELERVKAELAAAKAMQTEPVCNPVD